MNENDDKSGVGEKKIPFPPAVEKNTGSDICCGAEKSRFNFGRLFLGIIILLIGLFYLGQNAGFIPKEFGLNIWQLWPVLIIYFGLSIIGGRGWFSTLLGVIGTVFLLCIVIIALFMGGIGNFGGSATDVRLIPVNIVKEKSAGSGIINIKSGAGEIVIVGGAKELAEGDLNANFMDIRQSSSLADGVQTADIEVFGNRWNWGMGMMRYINDLKLKINSEIPVKINLSAGASNININSKDITLESAEIDAGASNIDLTLGEKLKDSSVKINAGASTVKIHIPQSLGVKLRIDGGLSSNKLDKFIKKDDKNYESKNYASSDKKVNIEADIGVSNLEIDWL